VSLTVINEENQTDTITQTVTITEGTEETGQIVSIEHRDTVPANSQFEITVEATNSASTVIEVTSEEFDLDLSTEEDEAINITRNRVEFADTNAGDSTYTIEAEAIGGEDGDTAEITAWVNAEQPIDADDVNTSNVTLATQGSISVEPNQTEVTANETITAELLVNTTENVTGVETLLSYDSDIFTVENVQQGPFLTQDGARTQAIDPEINEVEGTITTAEARQSPEGIAGSGVVLVVTLRARSDLEPGATAEFNFNNIEVSDENNQPLAVTTEPATVAVPSEAPNVTVNILSETVQANLTTDVRVDANTSIAGTAIENITLDTGATIIERTDQGNGTRLFTIEFTESTWSGGPTGNYETTNITATATTTNGISANATEETTVRIPGDATADGQVSLFDLRVLALAYNATEEDSNYNPNADLTNDGEVGVADLSVLGQNWRTTAYTTETTAQAETDISPSVLQNATTARSRQTLNFRQHIVSGSQYQSSRHNDYLI
jgi:hypothetical protein